MTTETQGAGLTVETLRQMRDAWRDLAGKESTIADVCDLAIEALARRPSPQASNYAREHLVSFFLGYVGDGYTGGDPEIDAVVAAIRGNAVVSSPQAGAIKLPVQHAKVALHSLAFHLAMSQADKSPTNLFDEERQAALDALADALAEALSTNGDSK